MSITIALALLEGQSLLHSETSRLDAELLLAHTLEQSRTYLFTWPDKVLDAEQQRLYALLLERRAQGEPVAYILGKQGFWSLDLEVDASTLIPRADTELLVELALEHQNHAMPCRALDLGTGTGAIALALASECPRWHVVAVDREAAAVALAQRNAQRLGLNSADRCVVKQSHWFSEVEGNFDLIVSNPPYIDVDDPHLSQGDVRFEPASALVAAQQGLADIALIIDQSRHYLKCGAWLMLEHGYQQADAVRSLMLEQGYTSVASRQDFGGNRRVTLGCFEPK